MKERRAIPCNPSLRSALAPPEPGQPPGLDRAADAVPLLMGALHARATLLGDAHPWCYGTLSLLAKLHDDLYQYAARQCPL